MADQKESSVLFSLKELMNLEEDRIREEEAEKSRRAKAELDAKEAKDRAVREAEETRLRAEEERRRQEELRKREETARLEAIKHGELEKARAEAEAKARLDAMAQQQAHEAQLAHIHRDKGKKRLQIIVGVVGVGLVAAVVGGGLAFKSSSDKAAQQAAIARQRQAETEGQLAALQAEIKASQEKEANLKNALENAKSEADRARIQSELDKAEKATQDLRTRGSGSGGGSRPAAPSGGGAKPSKPAAKESNCAPGDPNVRLMTGSRRRLAFPLDYPNLEAARRGAEPLVEFVGVLKVGLELFVKEGPSAVRLGRDLGCDIFLDLKLHDIPATVDGAVARACELGVKYLTIHASGGRAMAEAAVKRAAKDAPDMTILAVTVLTSLDDSDLAATGISRSTGEQVLGLARLVHDAGVRGFVCSPAEIAPLRQALGPDVALVTPGIRPAGAAVGDQKRVGTPGDAIRAGASVLVVGRPIRDAADPAAAARQILAELVAAETAS